MMQHHNYSLTELEYMIPWEREVYTTLLMKHLKDEEQRWNAQKAKMKT
jgi:hypothetical protein